MIILKEVISIQNEIIKPIPGFDDYFASNLGNIYSGKKGNFRKLKPFLGGTSKYLQITLCNNGKRNYCLVHRLVALTFIPNPDNLPEVDHKDKDISNNNIENLSWCTRKDNLNHSYSTLSPTRNYRVSKLYKNDELIGEFQGIAKAAKYAHDKFGVSEASLAKYLKCGDFEIKADTTGKYHYDNHKQKKIYKKGNIRLYKNGYFQKEFGTFVELAKYFNDELNIDFDDRKLNRYYHENREINGYTIKRAG